MSLVQCKECGAKVSTKAKTCPSCGAPVPQRTGCLKMFGGGFAVMALAALAVKLQQEPVVARDTTKGPSSLPPGATAGIPAAPQRPTAPAPKPTERICAMNDARCLGEKHESDAYHPCKVAIEKLARYQYEWTYGMLGGPFDQYVLIPGKPGHIGYAGRQMKFQNGFGAWQQISYVCHYNPTTKTAFAAGQPLAK